MIEFSNCLWIPEQDFSDGLRNRLTVEAYRLDGTSETVAAYRTDRPGYVGLPRVFGLKSISFGQYVDKTTRGRDVSFVKEVKLRDYQIGFVHGLEEAATTRHDFIAQAATGKGKTVCALALIQRLGRNAVVVVDQENLLTQWIDRCKEHLGLTEAQIGIVQGPKLSYEDKPITICMMQTLVRRQLPEQFYQHFGIAIFDECHTTGAPTFSRVLMRFAAGVRFGLSATPERRDDLRRIISWNLGSIDVRLEDKPQQSSVYIMESDGVYSWRVNNSKMTGRFVNEVADDGKRNRQIVDAVRWLYNSGRDILVIGDRVEHLCSLLALAEASGLPRTDLGLYAKSKTVFQYEKDPKPPRRPPHWEKGTDYTPIRLALVQKTIPKKQLEEVKKKARVIFATYGIMAKGVDIPRLSGGVDATPRSEATQVHGRILRTDPGKLRPIWVTLADVNSFRSLYQLSNRLSDYVSSNAELFLWDMQKGRKRLSLTTYKRDLASRISLLRQSQITTRLDGSYMVQTPNTPNDSASMLAARTAKTTRFSRAG
jgi:hypothetical protein